MHSKPRVLCPACLTDCPPGQLSPGIHNTSDSVRASCTDSCRTRTGAVHRQTYRQTDTGRQTGRQTERQKDTDTQRQTDRQTCTKSCRATEGKQDPLVTCSTAQIHGADYGNRCMLACSCAARAACTQKTSTCDRRACSAHSTSRCAKVSEQLRSALEAS